jgi:hypothetical protein
MLCVNGKYLLTAAAQIHSRANSRQIRGGRNYIHAGSFLTSFDVHLLAIVPSAL